mmetsp:Transcript_41301/g.74664  ORF Transcript_41301/g.74664 Transcript_41301/m.74664 type:complete len:731 (+) Transcript_41301:66-2258(+)
MASAGQAIPDLELGLPAECAERIPDDCSERGHGLEDKSHKTISIPMQQVSTATLGEMAVISCKDSVQDGKVPAHQLLFPDLRARTSHGETPLHIVAREGDARKAVWMLTCRIGFAEGEPLTSIRDSDDCMAIDLAVKHARFPKEKLAVLTQGLDPKQRERVFFLVAHMWQSAVRFLVQPVDGSDGSVDMEWKQALWAPDRSWNGGDLAELFLRAPEVAYILLGMRQQDQQPLIACFEQDGREPSQHDFHFECIGLTGLLGRKLFMASPFSSCSGSHSAPVPADMVIHAARQEAWQMYFLLHMLGQVAAFLVALSMLAWTCPADKLRSPPWFVQRALWQFASVHSLLRFFNSLCVGCCSFRLHRQDGQVYHVVQILSAFVTGLFLFHLDVNSWPEAVETDYYLAASGLLHGMLFLWDMCPFKLTGTFLLPVLHAVKDCVVPSALGLVPLFLWIHVLFALAPDRADPLRIVKIIVTDLLQPNATLTRRSSSARSHAIESNHSSSAGSESHAEYSGPLAALLLFWLALFPPLCVFLFNVFFHVLGTLYDAARQEVAGSLHSFQATRSADYSMRPCAYLQGRWIRAHWATAVLILGLPIIFACVVVGTQVRWKAWIGSLPVAACITLLEGTFHSVARNIWEEKRLWMGHPLQQHTTRTHQLQQDMTRTLEELREDLQGHLSEIQAHYQRDELQLELRVQDHVSRALERVAHDVQRHMMQRHMMPHIQAQHLHEE